MSRKQTQSRRQPDGMSPFRAFFHSLFDSNSDSAERRPLHDIDAHKQRVTQTNMVYLIGLPHQLADQTLLAQKEYCGQYGNIIKLLVKENHFNEFRSYCAYVTYERQDAAAVAVLALNNFVYEGSRIYASYGTNKYCSSFVKFGKCKKPECPFLHTIDRQKEIRQQDNRRLFQEQQQLARRFIVANESTIHFSSPSDVVFPTMADIRQLLIEEGFLKSRESKIVPVPVPDSRPSSPQHLKTFRSEASTECSPSKDSPEISLEADNIESPSIMKLIIRKIALSKKSLFSFVDEINNKEVDQTTRQLRTYFLGCQLQC